MDTAQAKDIDSRFRLLPGGSGEHDFSVLSDRSTLMEELNNFAESCGGLFNMNRRNTGYLLCSEGQWEIQMNPEGSRVVQVYSLDDKDKSVKKLYWDYRRERAGDCYQGRNVGKPFLSDYVLSEMEEVEEARRIQAELDAAMPTPTVGVAKWVQAGMTQSDYARAVVQYEIMERSPQGTYNDLVWSGVASLSYVARQLTTEFMGRDCCIVASHPDDGRKNGSKGPAVGDCVVQEGTDKHGVITLYQGEATVCFNNPSCHWNPVEALLGIGSPECSGGPYEALGQLKPQYEYSGLRRQAFWYWPEGVPVSGGGVTYYRWVNVWKKG